MIPAILFFGVLLAGPLFLAVRYGKRFEETIALTTGSIILFMFVCGTAGLLKLSVYLVLGAALALAGLSAARLIRKKEFRASLAPFFTPAFLAFCLVYLLLLHVHYGRLLFEWDEFTHWGDVVKAMCHTDAFSTSPESHSLFQSYVPGVALFQYLMEKIAMILPGGIFVDWRLYFACHLLPFIFLLPFFTVRKWRYFPAVMFIFLLIAYAPSLLTAQYLITIYVDGIVGLIAGAGFAFLFTKKMTRFSCAHLWVHCALLVLIKDVGILFAGAIGIAFLISGIRKSTDRKKLAAMLGLTVAAIALPELLWEISIRVHHAETNFRQPVDPGILFRLITGQEESYRAGIPAACYKKLMTTRIGLEGVVRPVTSYPALAAILAVLLFAARKCWSAIDPEGKRRQRTTAWTMAAVLVIYCLGLPLMYIFRFGPSGAVRLPSFDRYISIVFGCFIVMVMLLFAAAVQERPKRLIAGFGAFLLVGILVVNPSTTLKYLNKERLSDTEDIQDRNSTLVNAMLDLANGEEKHVWIIGQETNGYDYWAIRYGIRPCNGELNVGWSIAANTDHLYPDDQWTIQISAEEWKEKLKDYDYVLIFRANDSFREDYGALFEHPEEIGDGTIFAADHGTDLLVRAY